MPRWLGPDAKAHEHIEAALFRVFVEIAHPLTDLIVRYGGWLKPS